MAVWMSRVRRGADAGALGCGEVVQGRSDGGPRRVDAGEEQEDAHAEDLVATQGTPVGQASLRRVEMTSSVSLTVLFDVVGEVAADLDDGVVGAVAGEGAPFDQPVDPVANSRESLSGIPTSG
ncbi:MAG: hypothetical protein M5T61_20815 [Acidimicrobiia bacterium]|nr:hypothetical protein [Acidimicrobiia bacterium]